MHPEFKTTFCFILRWWLLFFLVAVRDSVLPCTHKTSFLVAQLFHLVALTFQFVGHAELIVSTQSETAPGKSPLFQSDAAVWWN